MRFDEEGEPTLDALLAHNPESQRVSSETGRVQDQQPAPMAQRILVRSGRQALGKDEYP